ncbi:MAG: TRAP transporter large permease [Burkholderiales bacterium]|nr:TRAP transporter large permease [Burkholderiales bacterium]
MEKALVAFAVVLALAFLRVPLVFSMSLVGFAGLVIEVGQAAALAQIANTIIEAGFSYTLSVLPLFVLMGNFANRAGLSDELYTASYAFLGHRRGGLAAATVVACGGFGAICGSSIATAATMAKVALPPMRRFGYSDALATGAIAAGGTLGILIPPSVVMIIYALITEENVAALFAAGIVPGLIAIGCYLGAVRVATLLDPAAGPAGERMPWPERWRALRAIWSVLLLFGIVMGGMYGGVFTPTEAAGIGAGGAFAIALSRRKLTLRTTLAVLAESARTTAMMFAILIGALMFASYINYTGMPEALQALVKSLGVTPPLVILTMVAIYLVLGCVLESLSMVLLTVPLFYPLVKLVGYDLVWFGIIVVCVVEISLITPPVGLNVFVLRTVIPDVPLATIFRGVTPFIFADIVRLAILIAFPALTLFLPKLLYP